MMKTVCVALFVFCGLAAAQGRELLQSKNNYCVTEDRATDFVGPFSYNFDSDSLSNMEECDSGIWDSFEQDQKQLQSDMWNQGKDVLVEALWPTLELATGDPESDVYLCDNGARWYTVNSFKGCSLQNGKSFTYRGNTYKAQGNKGVMHVSMALQYVCNGQARARSIVINYYAVTKTDCRK